MSHNINKVNSQEPNRAGEITEALNDLSDVSASSPSSGQTLRYDGANWSLGTTTTALSLFGTGQTQAYPTGGTALAVNVDLHFYGEAHNGAGATGTYTGWFDSVTLPAGSYILTAVSGITMSTSTGEASFRWYDQGGSTFRGTTGIVGFEDLDVGSVCIAYVEPTTSTTYSVRLTAVSNVNTLANQGNRAAERGFIEVRAL
jgi:hypothetical protein